MVLLGGDTRTVPLSSLPLFSLVSSLVLAERGLTAPMIRRVTGRSMKLVYTYLKLIEEYSGPDYAFRLHHLRKVFQVHEEEIEKNLRG